MALGLFLVPSQNGRLAKAAALGSMLLVLVLAVVVFQSIPSTLNPGYAYITRIRWIDDLGISYYLGVDRLSALLILITTLVGVTAIAVTPLVKHANYFYGLGLLMIGGMAGAFASLDLFFFYIFHELALIPTFLLIGIWGGKKRKLAAIKITLYLGLASLVVLFGFIGLYLAAGGRTFDLVVLRQQLEMGKIILPTTQIQLFGLLLLGFGTLIAIVPFHTWAPMGYGEAPPFAAMLHAGVIKNFGLYGLIRIAIPLLPEGFAYWQHTMVWLAVLNLMYGGYVAMQQKDLCYMLAYASVSHMGYALLALASGTVIALQGFMLFLFAHGLSVALGFAVAGYFVKQMGTAEVQAMGGLAKRMPLAATIFTMVALAGFGFPGFASFPAELMIFFGSFDVFRWATILAIWTTVISAIYFLRAVGTCL